MQWLDSARTKYPDARHHCWAYLLGSPKMPRSVAMSDDGEPSGTAGKPILNVLQHNDIGDVVIIVSRYFGGVKLGAGGLVRAYSGAAKQVLDTLPTTTLVPKAKFQVTSEFKHEQYIRHWVDQHGGTVGECRYTNDVILNTELPISSADDFSTMCASLNIRVQEQR